MTVITCKISEKLDAELEAEARQRRIPKSKLIRQTLEQRVAQRRVRRSRKGLTAYDAAKDLQGVIKGPKDLLTNPRYMEDFGA